MNINLHINGLEKNVQTAPGDSLYKILRSLGFHGVKFGDEHGQTGADTVLIDGLPINATLYLAAQAEGHKIVTIEALGEHPDHAWRQSHGLRYSVRLLHSRANINGQCTARQTGRSQ
jgi:aerobic-type carbon monoxide dehydrogenase small subunit (CoxS/CutS family)